MAPAATRRQRRGAPLRRLSTLSRATAQQATATPSAISAPTARARPPSPPLPRPRRLALFANGRGAAASESEAPLSPLQLSLSDSLSLSLQSPCGERTDDDDDGVVRCAPPAQCFFLGDRRRLRGHAWDECAEAGRTRLALAGLFVKEGRSLARFSHLSPLSLSPPLPCPFPTDSTPAATTPSCSAAQLFPSPAHRLHSPKNERTIAKPALHCSGPDAAAPTTDETRHTREGGRSADARCVRRPRPSVHLL